MERPRREGWMRDKSLSWPQPGESHRKPGRPQSSRGGQGIACFLSKLKKKILFVTLLYFLVDVLKASYLERIPTFQICFKINNVSRRGGAHL